MKRLLTYLIIISVAAGCDDSDVLNEEKIVNDDDSLTSSQVFKEPVLDEEFIDSTNIGEGENYKIIIRQLRDIDKVVAEMELFRKEGNNWILKQKINKEKNGITGLSVNIADFNNDGYNDITYKSEVAARGANELRNLFIFDKEHDSLVFVKNSSKYPNLEYNAELDCIDAWLVYGGSSTVFLKLENDILREFAGVSLLDTRTIYTIDIKGQKTILSNNLITDSIVYMRYSNFNPLKINEKYFQNK